MSPGLSNVHPGLGTNVQPLSGPLLHLDSLLGDAILKKETHFSSSGQGRQMSGVPIYQIKTQCIYEGGNTHKFTKVKVSFH